MNEGKISIRYARALFNFAKEEKLLDLVRKDMDYILELPAQVPEFKILTDNPLIKPSQKIKILKTIFEGQFQKITLTFLELVVQNNRLAFLDSIARVYLDLFKKNQGVKSALLVTPLPMDEDIKHSMISIIEKKMSIKIEIEEIINESLIGGFVLRIGNQQFDASVSNQLEKIKKELLNS